MLLIAASSACSNSPTEKYQGTRDKVIHVRDRVEEIKIEDPLIGSYALLHVMDEYLFIHDVSPFDRYIHLFDKNNFEYICSTAERGQGPDQITNMGNITIDEAKRRFYVSDHGKQKIFSYDLDSVLTHVSYKPGVKMEIDEFLFPDYFQIVNDSISICRIIHRTGSGNYKPTVGKVNMNTGEIELMKYEHPKITGRKRIYVVASIEHGIYVEYYHNHDLMTICTLEGDLICNVYGPDWNDGSEKAGDYYYTYYGRSIFCGDKIYAAYLGERSITEEGQSNLATKILVFDLQGNYIQTLETGLHISNFCYDKGNNRLLLSLNDEIQFAYLPLDGLK
ncbi:MAG: TolB-like 6-bladed beta-propeller domain-containing protein [Clostridiales bacterium]|nr:TolB-like 6-bladed beta-propeller domain-containing protein [Clostridiales bacterium]